MSLARHRATASRRSGRTLAALSLVAIVMSGCSESNPVEAPPRILTVDASGGGDYTTIQAALVAARTEDTVIIEPGVYRGPGNRNLVFNDASPTVSGATSRDETVIDCGGSGRAFYIDGNIEPVIENLTITGGDTLRGGGVYLEGSSPTFRNVSFLMNHGAYGGGGVYCRNGAATFENVLLSGNSSEVEGGGMLCVSTSPALSGATFVDNEAVSGAGLSCIFSSPEVTGCVFRDNHGVFGGAIYCGGSDPEVTSCTITANEASFGSGIYCADYSSASIRQTIIAFGQLGEGIVCSNSTPYTALSCIYANGELNEICGTHATSLIYEDPLFCDAYYGELTLAAASPCLPDNNDWDVLIGAFDQGCDEPRRRVSEP